MAHGWDDMIRFNATLPSVKTLKKTHVLLGNIKETDLNKIFGLLFYNCG